MIEFEKKFNLSRGRPFEEAGRCYQMFYAITEAMPKTFSLSFEYAILNPRQGLRLDCDDPLVIAGVKNKAFTLWKHTAPSHIKVERTGYASVMIRNIWDNGDGVIQSWHGGGALIAEPGMDKTVRLRCNSTLKNSDCNDLVVLIFEE